MRRATFGGTAVEADAGPPQGTLSIATTAEVAAEPNAGRVVANRGVPSARAGDVAVTRPRPQRGGLRRAWDAATAVVGGVLGLAPHVLHHVALLGGTALVAGSGGTALFGAVGLVASVPLLLRLRRRFRSWWAPAIGLGVFLAMFSLSAFVIGPAISGVGSAGSPSSPAVQHVDHH